MGAVTHVTTARHKRRQATKNSPHHLIHSCAWHIVIRLVWNWIVFDFLVDQL